MTYQLPHPSLPDLHSASLAELAELSRALLAMLQAGPSPSTAAAQ